MDDAEFHNFRSEVTLAIRTLADLIAAVVSANHHDGNQDLARFDALRNSLASRPDVSRLERAIFERVSSTILRGHSS